MTFDQSYALWTRAERALAGGPATLSKHPSRYPASISPLFLESASGAYVWDVDGNRYIDTVAALGPILLGHCDPVVTEAVARQVSMSTSLTLAHRLEVEVAEMLQPLLPWREQTRVRFGKDGMAATNAAIRLARHYTGGQHVLVCGYHGGNDTYMSSTDKNGGILPLIGEYTTQVPFGDIDAFDEALAPLQHSFAGMILEVPPRPWGENLSVVSNYLAHVRERTHEARGLLILDEIVTGFRYPFAWSMYGCRPDLICLGKGIANGYPLSVVAGPAYFMRLFDGGEVFWSTTFGGETIALAAAKATIEQLADGEKYKHLKAMGKAYGHALHSAVQASGLPVALLGNHARMILRWDDMPHGPSGAMLKTYWVADQMSRGNLYGGPIFPMTCWNESIVEQLVEPAQETLALMQRLAEARTLEHCMPCPPITDVFNTRYAETRR